MWRRLCIDVDTDGSVLGTSVETYEDRFGRLIDILVYEQPVDPDTTVELAARTLLETGFIQYPLPFTHTR